MAQNSILNRQDDHQAPLPLTDGGTGPVRAADGIAANNTAYATQDAPYATPPKIEGNLHSPRSGYWGVMIPALSARYLPEALVKLKLGRATELDKLEGGALKSLSNKLDTAYGLVTGGLMMAVTTFYMGKTYGDIKRVFSEPVAAETGKKPEDVTIRDILKSDNTLVAAARHNFFKYNARRYAMNLPFFAKHAVKGLSGDAAVGMGVAANSVYLMTDTFSRKETFFERLQSFIEQKLQHTDQLGEKATAIDLINLYELHARDENPKYTFSGRMDTKEWDNRVKIFGRMAELMNQTYGNEPKKEKADFTLAKMIYLMGHGMIDSNNPERSCTYIELANTSGLDAVKDAAMRGAGDLSYAKEHYLTPKEQGTPQQEQPKPGFAARFAPDAAMSKSDKVMTGRAAANENAFTQTA